MCLFVRASVCVTVCTSAMNFIISASEHLKLQCSFYLEFDKVDLLLQFNELFGSFHASRSFIASPNELKERTGSKIN